MPSGRGEQSVAERDWTLQSIEVAFGLRHSGLWCGGVERRNESF